MHADGVTVNSVCVFGGRCTVDKAKHTAKAYSTTRYAYTLPHDTPNVSAWPQPLAIEPPPQQNQESNSHHL